MPPSVLTSFISIAWQVLRCTDSIFVFVPRHKSSFIRPGGELANVLLPMIGRVKLPTDSGSLTVWPALTALWLGKLMDCIAWRLIEDSQMEDASSLRATRAVSDTFDLVEYSKMVMATVEVTIPDQSVTIDWIIAIFHQAQIRFSTRMGPNFNLGAIYNLAVEPETSGTSSRCPSPSLQSTELTHNQPPPAGSKLVGEYRVYSCQFSC